MLSFLIWGLVLNVYAFIVTFITARMVIPKSERKRDSKNIVAAVIAVMLVPYMMMALCLYAMIILVFCKFDYEELKKFKERVKGLNLRKDDLTTKQRIHLNDLHAKKRALYQARLNNVLSYDLSFYRFKNGKLNVSKLARCSGLSRGFLEKHLWFRGL